MARYTKADIHAAWAEANRQLTKQLAEIGEHHLGGREISDLDRQIVQQLRVTAWALAEAWDRLAVEEERAEKRAQR